MSRVVALIDGEHYPPVVRAALEELGRMHEIVGAVFAGGLEKVSESAADYGVPLTTGPDALSALAAAIERYGPDVVIDLSDEPVVSAPDRFRLASVALERGVSYLGADFQFDPIAIESQTKAPTLAVTGLGKRVGKTAVSAHTARTLARGGLRPVVLAMGRGGPDEPTLVRGDEVALSTADLLALARTGAHAASDCYEDAVMSRVATVGCRRCGGGMAGSVFVSNVAAGAVMADALSPDILLLEGSGAAVPPVYADANVLVSAAGRGAAAFTGYFGPLRLAGADVVVLAGADPALVGAEELDALLALVTHMHAGAPASAVTFRPRPIEPVEGARVFLATTAPAAVHPGIVRQLEREFGCTVAGTTPFLSDRARLRADLAAAAGTYDVLLTELKAAAIDVVAEAGEAAGAPTVLVDNVPVTVAGAELDACLQAVADLAIERAAERRSGDA